jgi:hypothetical protein
MPDEEMRDPLSEEELEEAEGEPLPDREEMSIVVPDPVHTLPVEPPATE